MDGTPSSNGGHSVGTRFAGRIGRHAVAYGAGSFSAGFAALVSVAVFTRYLDPSEFGKMAVLTTVTMLVTLLTSLTILPGTMRRTYGTTGDGDVEAVDEEVAAVVSSDPALVTSTGLAMILATGGAVLAVVLVLKDPVAELFGPRSDGGLILLAAGAGVAASVMRFGQYQLRMQLRSVAFLMVSLVFSFGSIAVAIPLLATGVGIEGVLIGLIVAAGLAAALSLVLIRHDLRPALSLREAAAIMRGGGAYLPVILSFQTLQLADTLFVAGLASFSQTGLYRVAQKVSMPVGFGTSIFQQSWGPMRHDMTQVAVDKLDESGEYSARLLTYYAVFISSLVLTIAVLAEQLVRLAPSSFGDAATLVPITTISLAGHGWFIFAYRTARVKKKMHWLVGLSIAAAVLFGLAAVALIPVIGAAGAPLAAAAAWGIVTMTMLVLGQRNEPLPIEYGKLATLALLTLAAWAISHLLFPDTLLGVVGEVAILLLWGAALFLVRIVPFEEVRSLVSYVRDATGIESKRRLRARIAALDGVDAQLVDQLVRQKHAPEDVAARTGLSEDEVMARAVHALRSAAGGGEPTESDAKLGHLLLIRRPHAEQHLGLMAMVNEGADPIDADLVVRAAAAANSRRWRSPEGR
ncbi:MAG TPA: lipopolysaccharide biosynthesis protein [Solirubrobacterales bacterium]|jgi:O-antigen/teichoic acid export membrane protein|nr:lipopolysaccharide biosynthesis protein [Solirubrobacterales bacterium]